MNKICIFVFPVIILLISTPLPVEALQIGPTPNTGTITVDTSDAFNSLNPFNNDGAISITDTGTLINNVGASLTNGVSVLQSSVTNAGTLINEGTLYSLTGSLRNSGTVMNSGNLDFVFGSLLNDGTLTNSGTLTSNHYIRNIGTLVNAANGTLSSINSAFIDNYGFLTNEGMLESSSGWYTNNYGTLTNNGILNNTLMTFLTNTGTLTNNGILDNNTGHVINNATLTNTGVLTLTGQAGFGTLSGTGTYLQTAGQTVNNSSMSQSSIAIQGGMLSGNGSITGNVTLGSAATLSPGGATTFGTLTVNDIVESSGDMMYHIGGVGSGQFDVLDINNHAFFSGGTIGFDFRNFSPVAGNSWEFLHATAITGWNTLGFSFSGLSPDLTYAFNFSNGVQTLTLVNAVPEPNSLFFLIAGLGGLAFWRNHQGA